jgi:hypothetical protein
MSSVEEDRNLVTPESSAGCASWPSDGALVDRPSAGKSVVWCRRCQGDALHDRQMGLPRIVHVQANLEDRA